jgi:proteic killer suppression protein
MEIKSQTNKLHKQLLNSVSRTRYFGVKVGKKIGNRLDEFEAADTLADISVNPPSRLHALKNNKQMLFAVDVSENYRLVFAGFDEAGNQIVDKSQIVLVLLLDVIDYH